MQGLFFLGDSIQRELKSIVQFYKDDWLVPFKSKANFRRTLSATIFIFFNSLTTGLTLASFLQFGTRGQYGVIEVLLSYALCGMIFSIFAGQGVIVVGVTGPVVIFSNTLYRIYTEAFDSPNFSTKDAYLSFMFWVGMWAGIMHIVLALLGACSIVKFVTRFSCEIFSAYLGMVSFITAIMNLNLVFQNEPISKGLLGTILAFSTVFMALALNNAPKWSIMNNGVQRFLSDYSITLCIILFSLLNQSSKLNSVEVESLSVPGSFEPNIFRVSWFINPSIIPVTQVFLAIIPGFFLTVLTFFDHNVSSLIAQQPHHNLKKPSSFNLDYLIIGITVIICGIIGIPFSNGLIPQAPLHIRALAEVEESAIKDIDHPGRFVKKETYCNVLEQRFSNFLHSLLIGIIIIVPVFLNILKTIPVSVLDGHFLFMGFYSLIGNHFYERFLLSFFVYDSRNRLQAAPHAWPNLETSRISISKIFKFTSIQLIILSLILGVTYSPIGVVYPLVILVMIPTRIWILPARILGSWSFDENDLKSLDGYYLPIDADQDQGLPISEYELPKYDKVEEVQQQWMQDETNTFERISIQELLK